MEKLAAQTLQALREKKFTLATAESCTGGGIAYILTEIAGSSDVVDRGFITYTNQAKIDMLDVPVSMLEEHGAVSEPVAKAMAEGALKNAKVDISVAVTGIAGPGGATENKPVGLVHFAVATKQTTHHEQHIFDGDRKAVRTQTIEVALKMILKAVT